MEGFSKVFLVLCVARQATLRDLLDKVEEKHKETLLRTVFK